MKRYIMAAFVLLAMAGSVCADNTSIFAPSEGWTKVTSMPTASEMEANYYVFVDVTRDLMLGIATGNNQGADRKGVYYQTCADPTTDLSKLWYIEANGSGYALRNVSYAPVQFNTDYNANWIYRPTDIADTKGGENSYSKLNFYLNNGKFTLENSRAAESSEKYIGPWTANDFSNGAECAANKPDDNKGEFYIYSIPRSLVFANKLSGAASDSPKDATIAIINPTFDDGNGNNWGTNNYYGGWTKTGEGGNFQCSNGIVESWNQTGFKLSQTISGLPNGSYTLSVQLTDLASMASLYAKNATETITALAATRVTDNGGSTYANMKTELEGGTYALVSLDIEVTNGTLEIGIDQGVDKNWMIFDTFKLTYKGRSAYRIAYDEYNALLANVERLKDNNIYQYIDDSGAKTTFENTISTANSAVEAATDAAAINTQTANLRAAALTFISSVTAEDGKPFDLTFLASRDAADWTAVDGDNVAGYVGWALKSNPTPYKFVEAYEQNDQAVGRTGNILTQTLSGMPSGYYTVALYGAACFTPSRGMTEVGSAGDNDRTYGFANNQKVGLPIFHASEIDAPTPVNVSVQLTTTGTLTYGIKKEQAGSNWHVAQIYTITYSKDPDLTVLKTDRDALVSEAQGLLAGDDANLLTTDQQNALSTAISNAEAANTFGALTEATMTTLPNAIQTARQHTAAVKANRVLMIAALERFENDYNLADGTDYRRVTMSADAWATLITKVNALTAALDDVSQAANYGTIKDALIAQMDATDASLRLFKSYKAMADGTVSVLGGSPTEIAPTSDTDTDATETTAITRLNTTFGNYAEAQFGDFPVSAFLGENLDFSAAQGSALNTDNSNGIYSITGWDVEYADADSWAVLQNQHSDHQGQLYMRKNWGSSATVLKASKQKMLPVGKYELSLSWDSSMENMTNLSQFKLGETVTAIGEATTAAKTLTYEFEVTGAPQTFDLTFGFQKTGTDNTPAQIVVDNVTLTFIIPDSQKGNPDEYTTYLTQARGFTEVTSIDGIIDDPSQCYIITAAENTNLFVGIGRYEEKPSWAGEDTKALRYRQAGDPVTDLSNFFTIEKKNGYIGLRNVVLYNSLFQTHDNAGFMYVLTYTEPTMSDWCYLKPTFQNGYWMFENGKYPASSDAWARGYMGPWNNRVENAEPIALNRLNTTGDEAGHYRLWRISRADLLSLQQSVNSNRPADVTWHITNPSFETGDETGWTLNNKNPEGNDEFKVRGDYGMTNKDGQYLMNAFQWWASSLSVSQTVTGLPAGQYTLSGVVASWEGRTVTFSANSITATKQGQGDQTGIPVSANVTIGTDGKLTINVGSTTDWWTEGVTHPESDAQCFFKLDDVQLHCTSLALDAVAVRLPNNDTTPLVPGQWYFYETSYSTEFQLIGPVDNIVYTTNGSVSCGSAAGTTAANALTLPVGRTYFKTTASNATLQIAPKSTVIEGTFTAVALNVDGLPKEINYGVGKYELNPDGPGAEGTLKISQYLASKGYDFIGCSEDFNYNGSLMESLNANYSCGTIRNTLSVSGISYLDLIQGKIHVETDGLNLIWKTTNSKISATNESWTRWWDTESTDGNQYVEKGYRHYDVQIDGGPVIDVFILHMDAGDTNATWSRESQWRQLADAINNSDHSRAKLIIGDTNSRYTRENVTANFFNLLSNDFTASDVWVEKYRNGIYPTTDMDNLTDQSNVDDYSKYEIVDKIIYINPTAANTVRLTPQTFSIQHDYTYGYVDGNGDTTPLGDHHPVVVTFQYQLSGDVAPTPLTFYDTADNVTAIGYANNVLADVTLQGRTLYKDGSWNTLCLPFSMTAEQIALEGSPLKDATIMELDVTNKWATVNSQWTISEDGHLTGLDGTTLYLNFKTATAITAGTPYIIKWASGDNLVNPTFRAVTVSGGSAASIPSQDGTVTFRGTYAQVALDKDDTSNLYLGDNNNLYYPNTDGFKLNAFRAYFRLSDPNAARQFVLNFGDETTGIKEIDDLRIDDLRFDDGWYTLDGRRMFNGQLKPGIYIHNGRKVVIK